MDAETAERVLQLVAPYEFEFKLARSRKSKLGDYRSPFKGRPHRISVNHDLNPYAFLVTLLHEIAHMHVFSEYGRKARPHGSEWKDTFGLFAEEFYGLGFLPSELENIIKQSLSNPKANSCADPLLLKALSAYDEGEPPLWLEELPEQAPFALSNGKIFIKGKKQRTRYRCVEHKTNRIYLIHGMAEVKLIA